MEIVLKQSRLEFKVSPELAEWWEVMAIAEDIIREQFNKQVRREAKQIDDILSI